ncbi:26215_t:CDS:2, partial [Gigaspora margarita]
DWFHSDLLKIFALNILKNSNGVEIHAINMEQYSCQRQCQGQNCGREIFTFQPIILLSYSQIFKKLVNELLNEAVQDTAQSPFESNTRINTDLNELNNRISFAEKKHNESIHK